MAEERVAGVPPAASSIPSRLVSGGAWALGGKAVIASLGLLTYALLARLLPPDAFGSYLLAFSIVHFGAIVGSTGLHQVVVRLVAESRGAGNAWRSEAIIKRVMLLGLTLASLVGAAYALAGRSVADRIFSAPMLTSATGLVAIWIVVVVLQRLTGEAFRGLGDIRLATIFSGQSVGGGVVAGFITVCGLLTMYIVGIGDLTGVLALAIAAGTAGFVLAATILVRKLARMRQTDGPAAVCATTPKAAQLLHSGFPVLVSSLTAFLVTQGDVWIIGGLLTQEDVALYGAAARMVLLVGMPLSVANAIVPPLIAELNVQGKKGHLEGALRATATIVGLPAFLVLMVFIGFGDRILELVYNPYYSPGWTVLVILSVGHLVNVWAGSCGQALMMTGHEVDNMKISLLSGGVAIGGGLTAVPRFGIEGMAAAIAVSLIMQNVLMVYTVRKKIGLWTFVNLSPRMLREAWKTGHILIRRTTVGSRD